MVLSTSTSKICVITPVNVDRFTLSPGYYLAQRTVYSLDDQFDRESSVIITRCDNAGYECTIPLDQYDNECKQGSILIETYNI